MAVKKGPIGNLLSKKYGRIAFITTPTYRKSSYQSLCFFVYKYMYALCNSFLVMTTGGTYDAVIKIIDRPYGSLTSADLSNIMFGFPFKIAKDADLQPWRDVIRSGLQRTPPRFKGMIHITYELIEGRLDAVIHLTEWQDKSAKADSAVLSREANVHNIPIATDIDTAEAFIKTWNALIANQMRGSSIFRKRVGPSNPPLAGIKSKHNVLAMVAHDNMKLEMCKFAVKNAQYIFKNYDYILATGTTGSWIKQFMEAIGRSPADIKKIRCCNSGPWGGDIQIAYAVVEGLCQKCIFLQDPSVSHPHDSDIKLFEQAVVSNGVHVKLATNVDSASLLI